MKKKIKRKGETGITLIALIITIIVLLILAGVSISMVVGDNGILSQAVNAADATDVADVKEQIQSDIVAGAMPAVYWYYTDDTYTAVTNGTDTVYVGDIIYYEAESGKTYPSYATVNGYADQEFSTDSYTYGWRILGADEETGELLIITLDLIGPDTGGYTNSTAGRTYFYMGYQEGYTNCEDELDAICAIYGTGTGATGGRSITVEDVNKLTGYDPETAVYGSGSLYQYGNEVTYYWDGTDYPYYSATNGLTGNLSSSHNQSSYTYGPGFVYFDTSSKSRKTSDVSSSATTEKMEEITTLTSTYYYYSGSSYLSTSDTAYELLFYNNSAGAYTSKAGSTSSFYYWLGSPCVYCYSGYANWGCRYVYGGGVNSCIFVDSGGDAYYYDGGVRPVVSLESDISLVDDGEGGWSIE